MRPALSVGLALLASLGASPPAGAAQAGLERSRELLAQGDYRGAWRALEGEPDATLRRVGQAELYYRAADPGAALAAAEAGLEGAPERLDLRHRAAASALWLGAGERALAHTEALAEAVAAASHRGDLELADREAWLGAVEEFRAEAVRQVGLAAARAGAVAKARLVAGIGLGGLMLALAWALLVPPRRRGSRVGAARTPGIR